MLSVSTHGYADSLVLPYLGEFLQNAARCP